MNLGEYFNAAVRRAPSAMALVDHQVRWTYADLGQEVQYIASGLWASGLRPGDRAIVLLCNRREHVVIFWACQQLGLVYIPVSCHFAPNDIAFCIKDTEPEALFFDQSGEATINALTESERKRLPDQVYTVGLGEQPPFKSYNTLRTPASDLFPPVSPSDQAIAVMLYSSGVTGRPKGIPRSHANEISATLAYIIHNSYGQYESTITVSLFSHVMGLRMLLAMLFLNGKLVLTPDDTATTYCAFILQEHISSLYAFPKVYHDLLTEAVGDTLNSIKKITYGGAPMSEALLLQCLERFSFSTFVNYFGSTEIYTYTTCSWVDRKPLCAGKAGINTQMRLVVPMNTTKITPDDEVRSGDVGELIVKLSSPEAFCGYWNRPDLTAKAMRNGWFFTGDLGRMDSDGDLWVIGRVDDMVICGGEKIYPSEVEAVLRTHPKVKEVAVVGIPDKRFGQLLTAFIVPIDATLTARELEQFCRGSHDLADFKRPAKYRLLEELPRRGGKLLRRQLLHLG